MSKWSGVACVVELEIEGGGDVDSSRGCWGDEGRSSAFELSERG